MWDFFFFLAARANPTANDSPCPKLPLEDSIPKEISKITHPLILGIKYPREIIRERITNRLYARLDQGMIQEVESLLENNITFGLDESQKKVLDKLFNLLVTNAVQQPKVFVHRDFHSRNLMVAKENNPGIIDYQDAVYGPISYDLVSILKDCYIKWPKEEIDKWVDFYLNKRHEEKSKLKINHDEFVRWFDLMGVQRHLKASGIFARLSHRDGKDNFLKNIPRTLSYILDLKEVYKELRPICIMIEELVIPKLEEKE